MNNCEYAAAVETGTYPAESAVPLDLPLRNEAGSIQNLLLSKFSSAALIVSLPGSVRSNHYHRTDWHYIYVLSGEMHYFWRAAGSGVPVHREVFREGAMMFTPPLVEHATFFPRLTNILTFARNIRSHEQHEADLVRVPALIRAEMIDGEWAASPC